MHVGADSNMTSKGKGKGVELAENSGKYVACGDSTLPGSSVKRVNGRDKDIGKLLHQYGG